jgi:hypothetical protein
MLAVRLLLRAGPVLLGAAAALVWLRRTAADHRAPQLPPASATRPDGSGERPVDIVTVVDDLLGAPR